MKASCLIKFLVVPTVEVRGNFIVEFVFCFMPLCLVAHLLESDICSPYNLKTNVFVPSPCNTNNILFIYGLVKIVHQKLIKRSKSHVLLSFPNNIFAKLSLIDYANKEIWRVAQINMLYILKMIMLSDNFILRRPFCELVSKLCQQVKLNYLRHANNKIVRVVSCYLPQTFNNFLFCFQCPCNEFHIL